MSVHFVTGDLLTANLEAIAHGVNCDGVMGAGIAPMIKNMYSPEMYAEYQKRCREGSLTLGDVYTYVPAKHYPSDDVGLPVLFNLATQQHPGPCASLDALRSSVHRTISVANTLNVESIGIPRIGAGLGGLDWQDVKQLLTEFEVHTVINAVDLFVFSLPGAEQ